MIIEYNCCKFFLQCLSNGLQFKYQTKNKTTGTLREMKVKRKNSYLFIGRSSIFIKSHT